MRSSITGWNRRFRVVLRPLRDPDGPRTEIHVESRTAAQATREATLRHPELKVVSVTRWQPEEVAEVAVLTPAAPTPQADARPARVR